jgi:hypothetical protein
MVGTMGIKVIVSRSPLNGITSIPNFMKIYQVVQKISTHDLYLNPATPLGWFCPSVNN